MVDGRAPFSRTHARIAFRSCVRVSRANARVEFDERMLSERNVDV
jgi:hypothetical protein